MLFEGADASGFEADARVTAMWLWTLGAGAAGSAAERSPESGEAHEDGGDDEGESPAPSGRRAGGYVLEYDAARKIAQGLGADLEKLDSLVELKGETARLLPVVERTRHLFGAEGHTESARPARRRKPAQPSLFVELEEVDAGASDPGQVRTARPGETLLDRLHQAMILFGAGRGEALRRFLVDDSAGRDPRLWKLAQSLAALYPRGSDERRWVEGVLARKKGLGL